MYKTLTEERARNPEASPYTAFAAAYFDLWWSRAGMGETDDVDEAREAYVAGELTDEDLRRALSKRWRRELRAQGVL